MRECLGIAGSGWRNADKLMWLIERMSRGEERSRQLEEGRRMRWVGGMEECSEAGPGDEVRGKSDQIQQQEERRAGGGADDVDSRSCIRGRPEPKTSWAQRVRLGAEAKARPPLLGRCISLCLGIRVAEAFVDPLHHPLCPACGWGRQTGFEGELLC